MTRRQPRDGGKRELGSPEGFSRLFPTPPGAGPYFVRKLPVGWFIFSRERGKSSRFQPGFTYLHAEKARSFQSVKKGCEAVLQTSHKKEKSLKALREQMARRQSRDSRKCPALLRGLPRYYAGRQSRDSRKSHVRAQIIAELLNE